MAQMRYSTRLADGRTLDYIPKNVSGSGAEEFVLDGQAVTEDAAVKAWDAQDPSWQRGRTLRQTLNYWQGRVN